MVRPSGVVTLLTDFGTRDGYAGAMKGRILAENPALSVVDLTHDVPPGDVLFGAFALAQAVSFFPAGTVHCAVVDPGVGSGRAAIVVEHAGQLLVGPNNGLFGLTVRGPRRAYRILEASLHPDTDRGVGVCPTFHGRDIFAPAAARLASGQSPAALGPEMGDLVPLSMAEPVRTGEGFRAQVIHVDRFGNLVTNVPEDCLSLAPPQRWIVEVGSAEIGGVSRTFSDVESGRLVAYVGGAGYVEVAVRDGSAARLLDLGRGAPVMIRGPVSHTDPDDGR